MNSEEGMECPVCWEGFNNAENTPYVLWCGHSLCKNCVMGLQWAVVKIPFVPVQLPLFISCPWCQFFTLRMSWKGALKYPSKNFFLLWIVDSLRSDNVRQRPQAEAADLTLTSDNEPVPNVIQNGCPRHSALGLQQRSITDVLLELPGGWNLAQWELWAARVLSTCVQLTAKLPLVFLFLFIIVYIIPLSAIILLLYLIVTVLFAVPSFLIVYLSYPGLDWLAREIVT